MGLPPAADNAARWPYARPLLADPALVPGCAAVNLADSRYQELLRVRASSPLFTLGTAAEVQRRLSFPTSGSGETPQRGHHDPGRDRAGSALALDNRGLQRLRQARFDSAAGTLTVPGRTVTVFVQA